MFVVRPVSASDIPALEALAVGVTPGVHTLPRTRRSVETTVERSLAAFNVQPDGPGDETYFFVLEAPDGSVAGTAAIAATAGARGTFFAFRNDVLHQVSRDLDISHSVHALTLTSALTACSQLSSFYLRNRPPAGSEAALLSRARLLFAAIAPQRFSEKFFAAMPGVTDAGGRSPFWEALGRKFFKLDFLEAERMIEGARNRTLIVELMPHYPVYVPLLPVEAQEVLGQVHADGMLAFSLLAAEGFASDEYLDIFDGGPILQAHRAALRSFADSTRCTVVRNTGRGRRRPHLVSNARDEGFRAVIAACSIPERSGEAALDDDAMQALDVVAGDPVLCVSV